MNNNFNDDFVGELQFGGKTILDYVLCLRRLNIFVPILFFSNEQIDIVPQSFQGVFFARRGKFTGVFKD